MKVPHGGFFGNAGALLCFREGLGPLHRGGEPLRHAGAGLPDDPAEPDAGGGHQDGEGPPRRHSQPRVPATAQRSGRHPEGEPEDVAAELKPSMDMEVRRGRSSSKTTIKLRPKASDDQGKPSKRRRFLRTPQYECRILRSGRNIPGWNFDL